MGTKRRLREHPVVRMPNTFSFFPLPTSPLSPLFRHTQTMTNLRRPMRRQRWESGWRLTLPDLAIAMFDGFPLPLTIPLPSNSTQSSREKVQDAPFQDRGIRPISLFRQSESLSAENRPAPREPPAEAPERRDNAQIRSGRLKQGMHFHLACDRLANRMMQHGPKRTRQSNLGWASCHVQRSCAIWTAMTVLPLFVKSGSVGPSNWDWRPAGL